MTILLLLSACATNDGPEYDGKSYNQIKRYEVGTIISERPVVISDDGKGSFFGMIIGAVLGSTLGGGNGSTLTALAGGIGGHYAGKEVGKANADELTVKLESGETIVIVVKGKHLTVGDKIKIIKSGSKVEQVDKID